MSDQEAAAAHDGIRTLRDVWKYERRLTTEQLMKRTGLSRSTLYKMNRKEEGKEVYFSMVQTVCQVLGISLDEYAALDPCPEKDKYPAPEAEGE